MAGERLLDNRYALLRVRGRGGMGVVWEARDEVLQRRVAVKEVDLSRGDPTARERVLREARVAARLKHSRLVDVYDIVEEGNRICLVQEFVDGPNLADVVAESGPLAPARAAAIGLELLDGLEAMHRSGVIHRDLKPSNVLLDGDKPRLTDYGIALVDDDPRLTSTGLVMGSPAYLSPEQALGNAVGIETDLWALGATLFYLVEGRAPYEGQGGMATAMQVVSQPPPTPVAAGSLAPVIAGLMRREPSERLRGDDLKRALARAASPAASAPPTAPTAVIAAAPRPAAERSVTPWLVAIAAVVAALLAAAAFALTGSDNEGAVATSEPTTTAGAAATTTAEVTTTTEEDEESDDDEDDKKSTKGVPDDWVRHEVDVPGYSVAVPPEWEVRSLGDSRTDFVDPETGTYLRVDWTAEPGDSPEEAWRRQSESFGASKDNYREIDIESTKYKGYDAALWEYTYSEGGEDLHAYNLGFVTERYGFALNFQASESRWEDDEKMFDQLKAGFEPPSDDEDDDDDDDDD